MLADHVRFLRQFLSQPNLIGAVAPSSGALAQCMLEGIDWSQVGCAVEYGPGTGAFTEHLLAHLPPSVHFLVIEQNQDFVRTLRGRFPGLEVHHDDVRNVSAVCRACGIERVDAVVSGLPWAAFSEDDQQTLLEATVEVLAPGGSFVTFAYLQGLLLPAGQRFRQKLRTFFSQVDTTRTVWRNVPPAFVYRCRR